MFVLIPFNRAMHVVLARYCYRKSSVRLSVRPSVTLMYAEHIGWTTSNNYLRQVNEVNGGDNAFVRCASVCLSVCNVAVR